MTAISPRAVARQGLPEAIHFTLVDSDLDELERTDNRFEQTLADIKKGQARVSAALVGFALSLTTASVMLALNLLHK